MNLKSIHLFQKNTFFIENNSYVNESFETKCVPVSDEKMVALLSHILTPAGGIFAPLIICLLRKDRSKFIAFHTKESLDFQITITIIFISLIITIVGLLVIWIIGITTLAFVIIATIKASEEKLYKYPFSGRLIK